MLINLDGGGVMPVLPECAPAIFTLVKLLARSAGHELHAPRTGVSACVFHEEMNMVGRNGIVEHAQSEALLRLEKPAEITASVARKKT
jgi:hypothetical protein